MSNNKDGKESTHQNNDELESPRLINLGNRVRQLRKQRGWTLRELSELSDISLASISKIERNEMSPTFNKIKKLSFGLGVDINVLFDTNFEPATGRRSITLKGEGREFNTPKYAIEALATNLTDKKMHPFFTRVLATSLEEFGDWDHHHSEDFMYVICGIVELYTSQYEPLILKTGDSVYFDGRIRHACVYKGRKPAEVLWVSAS